MHTFIYMYVHVYTMQLKEKYQEAWKEVMNNPISSLWDNMEEDRKEEILIGITNNMRLNND